MQRFRKVKLGWNTLNTETKWIVVTAAVARALILGVVYAFIGGFTMGLIIGLTELEPEMLSLIQFVISQAVNAIWFVTVVVIGFRTYLTYMDKDDDED